MARKAREKSKTGKYIVLLKGIEDTIFKSKKTQETFKGLIEDAFKSRCYGIRFFNDRVVVFLKETSAGIGMDMKPVLISFARACNRDTNEKGKVFADRFKSIPVEDKEFEAECVAYINKETSKDPFAPKRTAVAPKATAPAKPKVKTPAKPKAEHKVKMERKTPPTPAPEKKEIKVEEPVKKEEPKKRNNLPTWLL